MRDFYIEECSDLKNLFFYEVVAKKTLIWIKCFIFISKRGLGKNSCFAEFLF